MPQNFRFHQVFWDKQRDGHACQGGTVYQRAERNLPWIWIRRLQICHCKQRSISLPNRRILLREKVDSYGCQAKQHFCWIPLYKCGGCKSIQMSGLKPMGWRELFRPGIYTGNKLHAFGGYGEVGLLVLVLKGRQTFANRYTTESFPGFDSVLSNKRFQDLGDLQDPDWSQFFDKIVLRSHDQVLTLFRFPQELENNVAPLWHIHRAFERLIYNWFPGQFYIHGQRIFPKLGDIELQHKFAETLQNTLAPDVTSTVSCFHSFISHQRTASSTRLQNGGPLPS